MNRGVANPKDPNPKIFKKSRRLSVDAMLELTNISAKNNKYTDYIQN